MSGDGLALLSAAGLLAVPLAPLLVVTALVAGRMRPDALQLAPWAAVPALLVSLTSSADALLEVPWLLLGARFGVDATGRVFLFFTAVLWGLSALYARGYLHDDPRKTEFAVFFLLAMSGNLGLIVALDAVTFFLFFALMSFASYGLVVHTRDPDALRAGRVYMVLVVLGEVMLFSVLVVLANGGTTDLPVGGAAPPHAVTLLVLLGFGIKAGALPLHVWLPLAHPAAPVPASAVLSGAMIKAGLIGWLRFLPLGQVALPEWGVACVLAGLAAAYYGVAVGLMQTNPKTVLAYSSISQMGLMTMAVGLGMAWPQVWPAALSAVLIYALHHALAKGALFLGVGMAAHGGGPRGPALVALLLPALALAGLPLTSGAVAKVALTAATSAVSLFWAAWLPALLSVAAVGTTVLMGRFVFTLRAVEPGHHQRARGLWPPWLALLAAVAGALWLWPPAGEAARASLDLDKLWAALAPVAVGVGLVAVLRAALAKPGTRPPSLPPGDVLRWFERCLPIWRLLWSAERWSVGRTRLLATLGVLLHRDACAAMLAQGLAALEMRLRQWTLAGIVFILIALILFALMIAPQV